MTNDKPQLKQDSYFNPAIFSFIVAVILALLGLVILISAGRYSDANGPLIIFKKQSIFLPIALIACFTCSYINLEFLKKNGVLAFIVSIIFLSIVFTPLGNTIKGSTRWIELPGISIQVSDVAKIGFVIVLSSYISKNQRFFNQFLKGFVYPCAIIGTFCTLIIAEPDLGTCALFGMVGFLLIFLAGTRLIYLVPLVLSALASFCLIIYLMPNRLARVLAFLDPEGTKMDTGWQLWQSLIAFNSGAITGVGLGQGKQQIYYLSESHTDFILAVIGEELGLIATSLVLLIYLVHFIYIYRASSKIKDNFRYFLCISCLFFITLQASVNIGVATGCLPTKGMSLPFISYGGTNLVILFSMVGLMINCFKTNEKLTNFKTKNL